MPIISWSRDQHDVDNMDDSRIFLGSFEELPNHTRYCPAGYRIDMPFPYERREVHDSLRGYSLVIRTAPLDAAINQFKDRLSNRGLAGVYHFAATWTGKELVLKGYPFKKK